MLMKKFFVLYLISAYLFAICPTDVYAQKKSGKKSSSKNKSKKGKSKGKKNKSSKGARASTRSIADEEEVEEETVEEEETATEEVEPKKEKKKKATEKTADEVKEEEGEEEESSETAEGEETTEEEPAGPTEEELLNGVPADPAWEEFKFCMQQQCMGSPEQPNNVECYKSINFDNAFQSCKVMIPEMERHQLFKKYFSTIFLIAEQEEACRTIYNGKWVKEKEACEISITFAREYKSKAKMLKNDNVGCKDKKTKKWYLSAKKVQRITCSYQTFGLKECYKDHANYMANEIGMVSGIITTVAGVGAGFAAGASAAVEAAKIEEKTRTEKKDSKGNIMKDSDGNTIYEETTKVITYKQGNKDQKAEIAGKGVAAGFAAAMEAGAGMTIQGATQMVTAGVQSQDVGDLVSGTCTLPDKTVYTEGNVIELTY